MLAEQRTRVQDLAQAVVGLLERGDLERAEAVLDRAQQAQRRVLVAVEAEGGVDDVLERPRAGDRRVLGDLPDEQDRQPALLGHPGQRLATAMTWVTPPARPSTSAEAMVWTESTTTSASRRRGVDVADERGEVGVVGEQQVRAGAADALRPQRDLLHRFLAGDVEDGALQRRATASATASSSVLLPDPGRPAAQAHLARDQAAAEDAVELADAGGQPRGRPVGDDLGHRAGRTGRGAALGAGAQARRTRGGGLLDEGGELTALRAAAVPLAGDGAAGSAAVRGRRLGHGRTLARGTDSTRPATRGAAGRGGRSAANGQALSRCWRWAAGPGSAATCVGQADRDGTVTVPARAKVKFMRTIVPG